MGDSPPQQMEAFRHAAGSETMEFTPTLAVVMALRGRRQIYGRKKVVTCLIVMMGVHCLQ